MVDLKKIRVLVVDDSAVVRGMLKEIINHQSDMECVGAACDPLVAREMIRELSPDVITLDVEMPRMDGLDFLERLMRLRPMPVVMVSTLTSHGADVTMRALELGAVDFVTKPRGDATGGLGMLASQIVEKLRIAATAQTKRLQNASGVDPSKIVRSSDRRVQTGFSSKDLIFIGASTGGTEAIKEVLINLPENFPGIAITQHMPHGFTSSFATRLNSLCQIRVQEAVDGERLLPGHAYIAPGGRQFSVGRSRDGYCAVVDDGEPVNRHKPSVEVLFKSAAKVVGANAYGVMLTGMGDDGAQAMREMKDAGSYNLVQDESSCVVFGMPREAIRRGAAHEVLPLAEIADALIQKVFHRRSELLGRS